MTQSRFDQAAATWDEQPARVELATAITQAILTQVPVKSTTTVIDYGCGTGLVTLALSSHVKWIIGIDSSPGMLAQMEEKLLRSGCVNVETLLADLSAIPPPPGLHAKLIVSAMALHHIADISYLLENLTWMLTPGGYLALADLDSEDGSFHPDMTGVHHRGIDRGWLMAQLEALGYQDICASTAHVIERPDEQGALRAYPVFLVTGRYISRRQKRIKARVS